VSASPSPAGRSQPTTAPPPPAAPPANPANRAPITIGHVGTYSGVVGAVLSGGLQTAQAWARSVNARGGLGGHPVKLITADDGGDPARNLSVVKNMVENQGVIAFVGNLVPLSVNGSISYLTDKGVPAVGGDLVDPNWHEHPILYPQGTWVNAIAAGTVKVGAEFSGKRRVGILYCSEAAACQNAAAVAKASAQKGESGTQLVYSAQVSLAQPDFTAECLQAQRANVEILSVFTDGNTIGRVAKSCAQQNFKPQYTTSSLAVVNSLQSIPELEGLAAPAFDFPWMATDTPAAQEYQQAMKTFAPGIEPSGATALVWTSGKLLEKAASALSATPSPLEIQRGLWALKDETLGGIAPPLTFTQGQPPGKASCYFVVRLVSGKWSAPQGSRTTCL
jgi:branched-chain amino acid transport system substrate-binding protein